MNAYFNSDLVWGHFSFSREEVLLTLKLIDKTERHLVEQCFFEDWHFITEIWQLSSYVLTWSWNFHEKLPLHKGNWLVTTMFEFVDVIKIQAWSVFTIPQQIWKLLWFVCTLKHTSHQSKWWRRQSFKFLGTFLWIHYQADVEADTLA